MPKPNTDSLLIKYRPRSWEEFVGHEPIIRSLKKALERNQRVFLFAGLAGTGKTSFSYMIAKQAGCSPANIVDVDAATNSGIEKMRDLTSLLDYRPLGGGKRAFIIDEAQGLSKAAWDSLLKRTESPDADTYWFFCTTLLAKMPKAIVSRAATYELKGVPTGDISSLLAEICAAEGIEPLKGLLALCAREAHGAPRQGINNLVRTLDARDLGEAEELLEAATESKAAIDLCRALISGKGWPVVLPILQGLKETNPESIRYTVLAYVAKAILESKGPKMPDIAFTILECFSTPFGQSEGHAPLLLAVGRIMIARA